MFAFERSGVVLRCNDRFGDVRIGRYGGVMCATEGRGIVLNCDDRFGRYGVEVSCRQLKGS